MIKKFGFSIGALMAFAPSALVATPPPSYRDFDLSTVEVTNVMRATDARCPKKSDDSGSTMAKEPHYQSGCRYKQKVRSEARLNAAYKRTMARVSKPAQNALGADQLSWIKTRYDACERDRDENLGGALKNVLFYDCQILELKRRTLWIERQQ